MSKDSQEDLNGSIIKLVEEKSLSLSLYIYIYIYIFKRKMEINPTVGIIKTRKR